MRDYRLLRGLLLLTGTIFLWGCESIAHRDDRMAEIAGDYILSQVFMDNKKCALSTFDQSSLTAKIYESDGQWYFDAILPVINLHEKKEYHKAILPLTWDQVLCRYYFELYPEEQERLNLKEALWDGNKIQINISNVRSFQYIWGKSNTSGK